MSLEEHKRRERAQAIGLFRYQLICPALDDGVVDQAAWQAGARDRRPHPYRPIRQPGAYLAGDAGPLDPPLPAGGFEALVPAPRRLAARTDAQVLELAASLKRENPTRTVAQVARILRTATGWAPSESTLLRHFHRLELMGPAAGEPPAVFGRFEAADPNELWVGDALHGPRVGDRKTYLFAFLDDHCSAGDRLPVRLRRRHRAAGRGIETGAGRPRGPGRDICRQRLGVRRCVAVAGVRETRGAPGAFGARPTPRPRQDRTVLSHRARTVPRRGHRHQPARTSPPPGSTTPPRCWSSTGCS